MVSAEKSPTQNYIFQINRIDTYRMSVAHETPFFIRIRISDSELHKLFIYRRALRDTNMAVLTRNLLKRLGFIFFIAASALR